MPEIAPAASAGGGPDEFGGGEDTIVTVLPKALPALHRADGTVYIAPQTTSGSSDASRDVAAALLRAARRRPATR